MTLGDDTFIDTTGMFGHPDERIQQYMYRIPEHRATVSI